MRDVSQSLSGWMRGTGPEGDIVLGSRIRLARNLKGIPFPGAATREQLKHVLQIAESIPPAMNSFAPVRLLRMAEVEALERQLLVEEHLISPEHTKNTHAKGVILAKQDEVSVMINEEDHFRIQVFHPGLQLDGAWRLADTVDDAIEAQLDYAFDQERGYLTACPTNVGTGMRASVMLHLPALKLVNQVTHILGAVTKFGLAVRGLYGEGSDTQASIYQLSNQATLGMSEEGIIERLNRLTNQILEGERQAREYLLSPQNRLATEDRLYRSYGILTNARSISGQEAMALLSDVKLGVELGIITNVDANLLKQLIVLTRPAHLQKVMGQELPPEERDRLRASLIRDTLK
ncbi:MAG TPA: protein arginine kinase [Firmicutes bacterium]|jgi:protein arginine kinase|nr:protein arginine kinase [Bacillota bacterium]